MHIKVVGINNIVIKEKQTSEYLKITGQVGEYTLRVPSFKNKWSMSKIIKLDTKVFPVNNSIYFNSNDHSHTHKLEGGRLCLLHKNFNRTQLTVENFIKKILINYLAGYYVFEATGKWLKEEKNNYEKIKGHDIKWLSTFVNKVKTDDKFKSKQKLSRQELLRRKYVKTIK